MELVELVQHIRNSMPIAEDWDSLSLDARNEDLIRLMIRAIDNTKYGDILLHIWQKARSELFPEYPPTILYLHGTVMDILDRMERYASVWAFS